ncbi:MAG: hypothetical protein LBR75_06560 [Prevotellaceae bacterium]|jgi:hypothetical protein|nr:hypothetical protein [Prevotellaceae bacterium]
MQEKSLIKKNIIQFIEFKGITKYKLYQLTGITRNVLDQNNGMSEENTAKFLACFPEVDANWLLTGKGEMLLEKKNNFPVKSQVENGANDYKDKYITALEENIQLRKELDICIKNTTAVGA